MQIYDAQLGKNIAFVPITAGHVTMYVCGPTIYNNIHIGNARPVVFFDVVARYLRYRGYDVRFVSNITDVDDKIIEKALEQGTTEAEIVATYNAAFLAVCADLGVDGVERLYATDYITDMISYISLLIENGIAYEQVGDVYFRVNKVSDYGALANQTIAHLVVGARIDENLAKEHPIDFTLWKATDVGIRWDSPWSSGRPGWHTECAAMIRKAFGGPIDIHGGGMDLKFPHHENERAHAKAIGWDDLANYWMHNGFVEINDGKMSKSAGEIALAQEVVDTYGKNATRYWLLTAHYRQPLAYSEKTLLEAQEIMVKAEESLQDAFTQLALRGYATSVTVTSEQIYKLQTEFQLAMDTDFNTANALTIFHEAIKQVNIHMRHGEKSYGIIGQLLKLIGDMADVLGFSFTMPEITDATIVEYTTWQEAKQNKDFATADKIRDALKAQNIRVR